MKKLLFMMFLLIGTLSFANSGKEIDPIKEKKVDATVGCCRMGNFSFCGFSFQRPCDVVRGMYCAVNNCTSQTTGGIGQGNGGATGPGNPCAGILSTSCDCGGSSDGGSSNIN